jgi:hypothetical protein
MCHWYSHHYKCKHVTYALGKYCPHGAIIQTPCKKKSTLSSIWQTIDLKDENCDDCRIPERRGGSTAVDPKPQRVGKKSARAKGTK